MREGDKMDMQIREFLLLLLDDLTDLDRRRLHFALGNEVPKRLTEFSNIENTLQVFQHLIQTEKVFSSLVNALNACGRFDWAEKLKGKIENFIFRNS